MKIKRVALQGHKLANQLQQLPGTPGSQNSLLGHCIGYGEERPAYEQYPTTWQVKPYDESSKRSYVTFVFRYRSREFLMSQGIMTEDDGTAQQVPLMVQKARPAKRRVASAPLPQVADKDLITPSPTPSPNSKRKMERMSSSLKSAFNPAIVRNRPAGNVRTISMKAPGRHDRYPGEGTLQLYPTPNPNRFRKSPETEEESQNTLVDEGEDPKRVGEVVRV
ncbi:hypothetical protein BS17DRAFT_791892 [Gyrodon lividus]|nr:hypothetical protein BS17DRAFT_791892 [Gyrodon lividus]